MSTSKKENYHRENSVHHLFRELPRTTIERLAERTSRLARDYGLTYIDDHGKTAVITLTLRPRLISIKRREILWRTIRILDQAFAKVASLYFEHPDLWELFPFAPGEREWIALLQTKGYRPGRIVSRWDANTTFSNGEWREGYSFFEVNGVGVGGLWYGPACAEAALKTVVPELQRLDPNFRPRPSHDMRRLLLNLLLAQRRKLSRTRGAIALVMEKASGSNFIEFECLAKFFRSLGYPTLVTEPTDFSLKKGEIFARGKRIDILYRDTTLPELCVLEEKGRPLHALKEGFRRGQIVSSLEGEFDHKSVFEVFTRPECARFFTAQERVLFRRYVLWTRLLRETRTTDPRGRSLDLVPFVFKHQTELVLKPNRLYGGKGVLLGRETNRSTWERKIEKALKEPGEWVIQQLGRLRKKRFFRPDGRRAREKDLFVVSGFFATEKGLGIVGRMSERAVVNVARSGGLTPILTI